MFVHNIVSLFLNRNTSQLMPRSGFANLYRIGDSPMICGEVHQSLEDATRGGITPKGGTEVVTIDVGKYLTDDIIEEAEKAAKEAAIMVFNRKLTSILNGETNEAVVKVKRKSKAKAKAKVKVKAKVTKKTK